MNAKLTSGLPALLPLAPKNRLYTEIVGTVSSVTGQAEERTRKDGLVKGEPYAMKLGFHTYCLGHSSSKDTVP